MHPRLDHRPALAVLMAGIVGAQALGPVAVHGSAATLQTGGGAPVRGGTLTMLGQSDIFNLDTVSAYYSRATSWNACSPVSCSATRCLDLRR